MSKLPILTGRETTLRIDKVCASLSSQLRGLMFSRPKTLLFTFKREKRLTIHTWFVFFPITLVFLDNNNDVTETVIMRPWRVYRSKTRASKLIEIPYYNKFSVGQKIETIKQE